MEGFRVSMLSIVKYVGDRKRCWKEGEAVLYAGHILMCGVKVVSENDVTITSLCAQSSNVRGKPHEVGMKITRNGFSVSCSCKAGLSSKCKHCIAVLLYVNRYADC